MVFPAWSAKIKQNLPLYNILYAETKAHAAFNFQVLCDIAIVLFAWHLEQGLVYWRDAQKPSLKNETERGQPKSKELEAERKESGKWTKRPPQREGGARAEGKQG